MQFTVFSHLPPFDYILLCSVPNAEETFFRIIDASLVDTLWCRIVHFTGETFFSIIGASLVDTLRYRRTMPHTKSCNFNVIGAPIVTAFFFHRAMHSASSILSSVVGAPLMAATGNIRAVPDAKTSLLGLVSAHAKEAASFLPPSPATLKFIFSIPPFSYVLASVVVLGALIN
jgi:hypothetical protein